MYLAENWQDFAVLDAGGGMKLERWGDYVLARPDPQAIWEREKPELWRSADAVYNRSTAGGGAWDFRRRLPERWRIGWEELQFFVRPTGFKHTGIFPEQAANWAFMQKSIRESKKQCSVLNLFAYTGGATLACASAGAEVVHVDAAKGMVSWAKENAQISGLGERPIRYIVDDCMKFVLREQRRGRRYDGIIMDPPSYGRGADGSVWRVEDDLFALVKEAAALLSDDPVFFQISSYTTGLSGVVSSNMLRLCIPGGRVGAEELALPIENSSLLLPCGASARWSRS